MIINAKYTGNANNNDLFETKRYFLLFNNFPNTFFLAGKKYKRNKPFGN